MTPLLHARRLSYTYPGGFTMGPMDLDLPAGVHHLQGANGSGKTTLLRCLCADLRRSTGTLTILGRDPRTDPQGRAHVAWMAAEPQLPDFLTVEESWRELAAIRGAPSWDGAVLCARLALPGDLPLGHCSAGQRRMAELVAACVGDPAVLLLDEPFANLDAGRVDTAAVCNHTLRATGITAYMSAGGALEVAAQIAGHSSTRTTQIYDRSSDRVSLGEIERIRI